jgi:hypothetical protein
VPNWGVVVGTLPGGGHQLPGEVMVASLHLTIFSRSLQSPLGKVWKPESSSFEANFPLRSLLIIIVIDHVYNLKNRYGTFKDIQLKRFNNNIRLIERDVGDGT